MSRPCLKIKAQSIKTLYFFRSSHKSIFNVIIRIKSCTFGMKITENSFVITIVIKPIEQDRFYLSPMLVIEKEQV